MGREDWLLRSGRTEAAAERLYALAAELIAEQGLDALDIKILAERAHCSRATVYRYAGGKAHIRDVVVSRAALRVVEAVHECVEHLSGGERLRIAITTALREIRADPLGPLLVASLRSTGATEFLTESAIVTAFARELGGVAHDDHVGAHWLVRVVLTLLSWPVNDPAIESEIVARFIAPPFAERIHSHAGAQQSQRPR